MIKPDDSSLNLLHGRRIAALSTHLSIGQIHMTAVWFLFKDGDWFVTTNSNSQKVRNLRVHPEAALLVESCEPGFEQGVTARGSVTILDGEDVAVLRDQIHERYLTETAMRDPQVGGFFASFDDIVLCLSPRSWSSWDMGQLNRRFFSGTLSTSTGYMHPLD